MYDFFVIGDILVDHIILITDPKVVRTVDSAGHSVTLPFPTKIQLEQPPRVFTGGNAFNAAFALKWLGLNVGVYSVVGDDPSGESIIKQLRNAGINADMVAKDKENGTNQSTIINIANDRIVLSHHYPRNYDLKEIPETKFVYLTSVGEDDKKLFDKVIEEKQKRNFKLVFSPGTRQLREPFPEVKAILEHTDYLILNKREAQELSKLQTNSEENLLRGLSRFGPKHVVITKSAEGSVAITDGQIIEVGSLVTENVDTTGAGDTFCATVSMGILMGKDLKTAMEWGAIHSANVISHVGATNGLLNRKQLEEAYQQHVQKLIKQNPQTQQS